MNEDAPMTLDERSFISQEEHSLKELEPHVIPELGMQRYIHKRPDKEAYQKARDAEYEAKRKGRPDRVACKKRQYQRHREDKLKYQKKYYDEHKDEILAKQKSLYEENKDEINAKRREARRLKHPPKPKQTYEEKLARNRQYRLEHRDEINRKKREAYHRKKGEIIADNKE